MRENPDRPTPEVGVAVGLDDRDPSGLPAAFPGLAGPGVAPAGLPDHPRVTGCDRGGVLR